MSPIEYKLPLYRVLTTLGLTLEELIYPSHGNGCQYW
jgi:hypothetical protein